MSFLPVLSRLLAGCCSLWLLASRPAAADETIHIDLAKSLGPIRALHGANFGPLCANGLVDLTSHQRQLQLPSTRLHDIPWTYGEVIEGNFKPSVFVSSFLAHCQKHRLPLDFFSWHIYTDDPQDMLVRARGLRTLLDTHGFSATQLYLDEWNYLPGRDWSPFSKQNQGAPRDRFFEAAGGADAAAFVAAFLIRLQDSPVDLAHFFSADNQGFGLFTANGAPRKTFHAFRAIGELSRLPNRLALLGALTNQVEALAGADPQRGIASAILVNRSPKPLPLTVTWQNLPSRSRIQCTTSLLDATSDFKVLSSNPLQPDQPTASITLPPASVVRLDLAPQ